MATRVRSIHSTHNWRILVSSKSLFKRTQSPLAVLLFLPFIGSFFLHLNPVRENVFLNWQSIIHLLKQLSSALALISDLDILLLDAFHYFLNSESTSLMGRVHLSELGFKFFDHSIMSLFQAFFTHWTPKIYSDTCMIFKGCLAFN
jgi:hypothetical protein